MNLIVRPSEITGRVAVPGSKSHTIRAVAAALAAGGESIVHAPLISADTISTLNAAERLGAKVVRGEDCWRITGTGGDFNVIDDKLDMGNSGTGLRILSAIAATGKHPVTFDGDDSLRGRLMKPLLDAMAQLGVKYSAEKCPLTISGPLHGGKVSIEAPSSQFLTALLFALPMAEEDSEITVTLLHEAPYVGITLKWLKMCGIEFEGSSDYMHFVIPGGQRFRPFETVIPADFSTAAFPLVAATIAGKESVEIANLDFDDVQGDKAVFDLMTTLGADIQRSPGHCLVKPAEICGADLDLNATPDALPILAVAGACSSGVTRLLNVPQARLKESDRISCMTCELRKMGAEVEELDDGMVIHGGKLHGAELESYGDHRIAMALAVAALTASTPSVIKDAECAAVTYPGFVEDFRRMGADFELVK